MSFDVSERYFEPEGSEGAAVLRGVLAFMRRHFAASDHVRVVLTVWAAHTHALDVFGTTPYLHVTSVEPESGKSRVLELLELLCREPIRTASISLAATFRAIQELRPTLLLDEVDNLLADRSAKAELLGILNDGYRRGGIVLRMGGPKMENLERFEVFCPKAFAGLRELPTDALRSRCLRIEVKPRLPTEPGEGFIFEDEQEGGHALRDRLAEWSEGILDELRGKRPERIERVRDRTWESVRPLVVIADAAGDEWPTLLRAALLTLVSESEQVGYSAGVRLLADCRRVFEEGELGSVTKVDMLEALGQLDNAPYAEWDNFSTNRLSRQLKRYGVPSDAFVHDEDGKSHRGWKREHFADAWARFLPDNRANRADGLVEPSPGREKACAPSPPHTAAAPLIPDGSTVRTVCTFSVPLPGEDGFRELVNRAYDAGHLTDRERQARRLLHNWIARAQLPAGEQATLRELGALAGDGVLVELEAE